MDHPIQTGRSDPVIVSKEKKICQIADAAVLAELEKVLVTRQRTKRTKENKDESYGSTWKRKQ